MIDNNVILQSIDLGKQYGKDHRIFDRLDFTIQHGEFVTILGLSGCGKTTLLHIIADLVQPSQGRIVRYAGYMNGKSRALLIFQEYNKSLFPWKTVYQNIEFFLENCHDQKEKARQINKYLTLVGLQDASSKYPWQLSGGMQQRVAIARALTQEPGLLLMDEPFGSLDAAIKRDLELELLDLWQKLGITILFVSHDIEEAIFLSTRIMIMGKSPAEIIADFPITMPYPREYVTTKNSKAFGEYRAMISQYF